jgi:hypothetical protein
MYDVRVSRRKKDRNRTPAVVRSTSFAVATAFRVAGLRHCMINRFPKRPNGLDECPTPFVAGVNEVGDDC